MGGELPLQSPLKQTLPFALVYIYIYIGYPIGSFLRFWGPHFYSGFGGPHWLKVLVTPLAQSFGESIGSGMKVLCERGLLASVSACGTPNYLPVINLSNWC